jgi:hypothetical protein
LKCFHLRKVVKIVTKRGGGWPVSHGMVRRTTFSCRAQFRVEVKALQVDGQHLQDAGSVAIGTIDKGLEDLPAVCKG